MIFSPSSLFSSSDRIKQADSKLVAAAYKKLPIMYREDDLIEVLTIISQNLNEKADESDMRYITLPILSQTYGSGKSYFLEKFEFLFEKHKDKKEIKDLNFNKKINRMCHIYIDMTFYKWTNASMDDDLSALIIKSFFKKYQVDVLFKNNPSYITLKKFLITTNDAIRAKLLNDMVDQYSIDIEDEQKKKILNEIKDAKYEMVFLKFDEIGTMKRAATFNSADNQIIEKEILELKILDSELYRMYYFWKYGLLKFQRENDTEIIVAGKDNKLIFIGKHISQTESPTMVQHITLNPLTRLDVLDILQNKEVSKTSVEWISKLPNDEEKTLNDICLAIHDVTDGHPLFISRALYYTHLYFLQNPFNSIEVFQIALQNSLEEDGAVEAIVERYVSLIMSSTQQTALFVVHILKNITQPMEANYKYSPIETTFSLIQAYGFMYKKIGTQLFVQMPTLIEKPFTDALNTKLPGTDLVWKMSSGIELEKQFINNFQENLKDLFKSYERYQKGLGSRPMTLNDLIPALKVFEPIVITKVNKEINVPQVLLKYGKTFSKFDETVLKCEQINIESSHLIFENARPNVLHVFREASESCDSFYPLVFSDGNKEHILYLMFQLKNWKDNSLKAYHIKNDIDKALGPIDKANLGIDSKIRLIFLGYGYDTEVFGYQKGQDFTTQKYDRETRTLTNVKNNTEERFLVHYISRALQDEILFRFFNKTYLYSRGELPKIK